LWRDGLEIREAGLCQQWADDGLIQITAAQLLAAQTGANAPP
jgi:hypothetical protein